MPKWMKVFLLIVLIPLTINLITNFLTWFTTKEKVEVTFKLDGWITVGSIRFGDLPHLKLMLDSQEVKNITKVSWRVINTGDKGIAHFENGPFIEIPTTVSIVLGKISEASSLLNVSKSVRIKNNIAFIDSLGIFNPGDFFKIDFYLQNITEENISTQYFEKWNLSGKSLDLAIAKDISFIRDTSGNIESVQNLSLWRRIIFYLNKNDGVLMAVGLLASLFWTFFVAYWRKKKFNDAKVLRSGYTDALFDDKL